MHSERCPVRHGEMCARNCPSHCRPRNAPNRGHISGSATRCPVADWQIPSELAFSPETYNKSTIRISSVEFPLSIGPTPIRVIPRYLLKWQSLVVASACRDPLPSDPARLRWRRKNKDHYGARPCSSCLLRSRAVSEVAYLSG